VVLIQINYVRYRTLLAYFWEKGEQTMDKDRIKGSAEQVKGAVKEAAGKMLAGI